MVWLHWWNMIISTGVITPYVNTRYFGGHGNALHAPAPNSALASHSQGMQRSDIQLPSARRRVRGSHQRPASGMFHTGVLAELAQIDTAEHAKIAVDCQTISAYSMGCVVPHPWGCLLHASSDDPCQCISSYGK